MNWTRYHSLLGNLARDGHEIFVLQPPALKSEETNFQDVDVDVEANIYLHEVQLNTWFWNTRLPLNKLVKKGYYSAVLSRHVERIVRDYRIDVLFLYNIPHYPLLNVEGCIKIFDVADDYIAMLKQELGRVQNWWLLSLGEKLLKKMIEQADISVCVSHVLAERMPGRLIVLPNGVDCRKAKSGGGAGIRKTLRSPIVGFIGSFEYFVDFDLILDVAGRLPDITFLLVGGGRQWRSVRQRVGEKGLQNVVMPGGVAHSQVFSYIDAMDVCLNIFKKSPISHAACPIKLFEYFAMKKPVISTRLGEVERIDRGCLFYADTADELVTVLKNVLADGTQARQHAESGYRMVYDQYNWESIARRLVRLIEATRESKGVSPPDVKC